jgi:saccharopine dehydrogenase-like NADP-dependent oxidoreductase
MTKVLVIGAGAQGGPSSSILAGEPGITEIRLGDINLDLAKQVADKVGSSKVIPMKLDASNKAEIVKAAEGVDLIMNFTLLKYNHTIMEAALEVQAHYVDTACSTEFLQHWISGEPVKLDEEFSKIGKTALVSCGFAPGIANILARYACDQMERVEKIVIRVGRKSQTASDEVVSAWRPTWSPEIMLEDYAEKPMVFKAGKFVEDPIFSNPETYTFPDPIGDLLLSSHSHEETYLMAKYYVDKGLQELDFKYPVDKIVGALIKMGFADHKPIDVKGVKVAPVDVLMALVKRPGNKFFLENEETILQSDLTGIMDISVDGVLDGDKVTKTISYTFTDGPNKEHQKLLYETFGTTMVYVALPAMAGANMCLNGEVTSGVVSPDVLDPATFFGRMAERGVPFKFDENTAIVEN